MFDCALHFRFLQKATEAMFEMGQASVAAALACQKHVYEEMTPESLRPVEPPKPMAFAWPNWFPAPVAAPAAPQAVNPALMQSWFAMANACSAYWTTMQTTSPASTGFPAGYPPAMSAPIPAAMQAFWGVTPWTFYQAPMMAMMLSYGVPYAVAAPTARASTSAMDAADAACTQWRLVFGSDEGRKSLARNVPSTARWPTYLH